MELRSTRDFSTPFLSFRTEAQQDYLYIYDGKVEISNGIDEYTLF